VVGHAAVAIKPFDELGDAAVVGSALFVTYTRPAKREHAAAVARIPLEALGSPGDADAGDARAIADVGGASIELGTSHAGDSPPRLFVPKGDNALVAATYAREGPGDGGAVVGGRALSLYRLAPGDFGARAPAPFARLPQADDASSEFDVAFDGPRGLVAWDEDAPSGDHGVIRVRALAFPPKALDAGPGGPVDADAGASHKPVSPDTSDAESPRLVPRPGGYWLAWLAGPIAPAGANGPRAEQENPTRALHWVEVVPLDAAGAPVGAVHPITPATGQVLDFEVGPAPDGGLDVFVHDAATPESGGAATRLRVASIALPPCEASALPLVPRGTGPTPIAWIPGTAAGTGDLFFRDPADHLHRRPVVGQADGGLAGGAEDPSREPALDGLRPLAALPGGRLVVARPENERGGVVGVAFCARPPPP
jgi:hypothetical protein